MSETDPLTQAAELIRSASVMIGTTDLDHDLHKQRLFLVVSRFLSAETIFAGHLADDLQVPNRRTSLPDDEQQVRSLLDQLPIVYQIDTSDPHFLAIHIAKDIDTLDKYLDQDTKNLRGLPQTVVEAAPDQQFTLEEQEQFFKSNPEYTYLYPLTNFFLTKENYQDELATVRTWYQALEQYNLI